MSREEDLELALDAAIHLLEVYEHGDSRCVSDARKQGWNKKVELGEHFLFKRTKRVLIIDEATND